MFPASVRSVMTPEIACLLALIGYWQRQFIQAKGSNWRASKEWRESCPGCGKPRGTLEEFIEHHKEHTHGD